MGSFGQCTICGEKIEYNNIASLGLHLLNKHPNNELAHFSLLYEAECKCCAPCRHKMVEQKRNAQAYKTTIESWKMAQNPQKCFKCGKIGVPVIRRQRHALAKSPFGAFILLGCWPICFLPFILGGSDLMYLYCKVCGNFLGMYDRRINGQPEKVYPIPKPDGSRTTCGCNNPNR